MSSPSTNASCRPGCGACCVAPSISSPIPGMPRGKPAGVRCVQLNGDNLCRLFGDPRRPRVCADFTFDVTLCGSDRQEALARIAAWEDLTCTD
ncbi:YkgJ family cysteine cluster protein [Pistricoccus aurantiacus]|uniref:YkgJ family cysteine cluster protein n=1 Tax=Pistricoccus aurantiacus TaxID=1883414 RepID=A0A5B8SYD4_9GAMM|nr:YkgJ family cysteine cluster protein [Pistricoccus aurantiacus]QEA39848.1 YkgJ family cysteine cluster protein [Pistricoccus aurantiacus]